jgi:hypothetical protein
MPVKEQFRRHVEQFDLDILFEQTGARGRVAGELQKGDIFGPYQHLLETDETWIQGNWESTAANGYAFVLPESSRLRTALDCDKVLTSFVSDAISTDPFVMLFSSRAWNIGRGGEGIKSVIGVGPEGWKDFGQQRFNQCKERLNAAITLLGKFDPSSERCDSFFDHVVSDHDWRALPDITILFHLVWPQFYPVWYRGAGRGTGDDSYSQITGIEKLLDVVADVLRVDRKPLNLLHNYAHYAAAYRALLLAYDSFIWGPQAGPRDVPHFDFLTELLAELDAQAEAAKMLLLSKALVVYGVPGTGKTHTALTDLGPTVATSENIHRIQFHPGYSYADFIIGIRPQTTGTDVAYPVVPGVLYRLAAEAAIKCRAVQRSIQLT